MDQPPAVSAIDQNADSDTDISIAPRRNRYDWRAGARLIAEGRSVEAVAASLGCPPKRVRRNLDRSARLHRLIDAARQELADEASRCLDASRGEVTALVIDAARRGDTRALLWLAERLKLSGPVPLNRQLLEMSTRAMAALHRKVDAIAAAAGNDDDWKDTDDHGGYDPKKADDNDGYDPDEAKNEDFADDDDDDSVQDRARSSA